LHLTAECRKKAAIPYTVTLPWSLLAQRCDV
jgi:hypothetical protein